MQPDHDRVFKLKHQSQNQKHHELKDQNPRAQCQKDLNQKPQRPKEQNLKDPMLLQVVKIKIHDDDQLLSMPLASFN
jgi:hypothetical protein